MRRIVLQRFESGDQGTFGKILNFFSLELPWRDNKQNISCVPKGIYECSQQFSPRFQKKVYALQHVQNRSSIEIHPANFAGDISKGLLCQLNGCIALGEKIGVLENQKALLLSRPAVFNFESLLERKPFILEIK